MSCTLARARMQLAAVLVLAGAAAPAMPAGAAIADSTTAAGPVITFLGQRFAIAEGPPAFDCITFDAAQRRIVSHGRLRDLCGSEVAPGPDDDPGLAWDPASGLVWDITPDRCVRRWSGGALLDTVFTLPAVFDVPGVGSDTLESPRGIAVDSVAVYVVDAGPAPGAASSNEWFKFTRAGVPLRSSKSTDFVSHLDLDPDALVDDIAWVSSTSPVAPGCLLIALEHSGIQVVDTSGAFVGAFRWSTQALPAQVRASAFAGITVDPLTGDLYLADNDRGIAQRWSRLPGLGAASFLVGTGSGQAYLQSPNPGCNAPLLHPLAGASGAPSLVFGIAYRPVDHDVYGVDYATGDLWRFDPRSGSATRVGGTGVIDVWGLAYDPQRDVFYGGEQVGADVRLRVIDPASGANTALPAMAGLTFDDLAFDTADRHLYAVSAIDFTHGTLVRIDPDSGVADPVGPTTGTRGIEYDPVSGRLLATRAEPYVFRIDPATGAFDTLTAIPLSGAIGWEGLAVVTVPASPLLEVDRPSSPGAGLALRVGPDPARGPTWVAFDLDAPALVTLAVYDVAGRRVRRLAARRFAAGRQVMAWDGADEAGAQVAPGLYLVRVQVGSRAATARVARLP